MKARSVTVDHITKGFGGPLVLQDVTMTVAPAEVLVLLGPSGCGKTTLLRTIAGLERPDSGTVSIGDDPMSGPNLWVPPERRQVGMVFQDWALFPHLSVADNVAYGLPRSERSQGADSAQVRDALDLVGLADFGDRSPDTLSGGQKQRVALARALAPRPSVLLLDEPFSNLDTSLRLSVRTEVLALLLDLGITAIFVTHDQEEAFVLGDRVAVMDQGQLSQVGTPSELYMLPASRWVAGFVGKAALASGQASGTEASCLLGNVSLLEPRHGDVDILVRPECVALTDHGKPNGTVELVEYYGHDAMVIVRLADDTTMPVRAAPDVAVNRGDAVTVAYIGGPTVAFDS